MQEWIRLGADQFILYVRKRYGGCSLTNDQLTHRIWWWLREHDVEARRLHGGAPQPCLWGVEGDAIGPLGLPTEALEFQLARALLPDLFGFLDQLCQTVGVRGDG